MSQVLLPTMPLCAAAANSTYCNNVIRELDRLELFSEEPSAIEAASVLRHPDKIFERYHENQSALGIASVNVDNPHFRVEMTRFFHVQTQSGLDAAERRTLFEEFGFMSLIDSGDVEEYFTRVALLMVENAVITQDVDDETTPGKRRKLHIGDYLMFGILLTFMSYFLDRCYADLSPDVNTTQAIDQDL